MKKYLVQAGGFMLKERACVALSSVQTECAFFYELSQKLGNYIPVGTVEFTIEFAKQNKIVIPGNLSYPLELRSFLGRDIWRDRFGNVPEDMFVKPVETKIFTGGIKKDLTEKVADDVQVWAADPISITAEFRCYIVDKEIVGISRYDDGDDEIEFPGAGLEVVQNMIARFTAQPAGYAIDVGLVDTKPVLIEVNDGWALGYYPWGTMSKQSYTKLITKRWEQITSAKLGRAK